MPLVSGRPCCSLLMPRFSAPGVRRCEDGCRPLTPWSTCVSTHSPTLTFSMNGDMPHVPITTLAGIASLTDCEWNRVDFLLRRTQTFCFTEFERGVAEVDSWRLASFAGPRGTWPCLVLSFSSSDYFVVLLFPSQCWTSSPSLPLSRLPPLRASCTTGGLQRKLPAYWVVEMRIWPPSWPMASTRSPQSTCEFLHLLCKGKTSVWKLFSGLVRLFV